MNITEREYLDLFDNFVSSVVILDKSFNIIFFNKQFAQLTGYNIKRIKKGLPFFDFFPLEKGKELFDDVIDKVEMSANIELESKDKDGQQIKVLTNVIPLERDGSVIGLLMNMIDISVEDKLHQKYKKLLDLEIEAKKGMRMQLIQSEKMASLGTLLAGISHELNNPLAILMGSMELIKAKEKFKEEELLGSVLDATKRMSVIVNKLRIFSRKASDQFEIVYLNNVIEDILMLFNKKMEDENIKVIRNLSKEEYKILGDDNLLGQVIMNVLSNAIDAMEKSEKKEITITSAVQGDLVTVTVSDTGLGISEEIKHSIFDPFFTTKAPNKGTGLGLSIVYQILKLHNASIEFLNNVEGGASFVLTFNLISSKNLPKKLEGQYSVLKKIKVLFVDDEENLLTLINYMFRDYFEEIHLAKNGVHALDMLKRNKIDLLVTDVRMPEMDGYELVKICRKEYPSIPVISLSGSDTIKKDAGKFNIFDLCLDKPFSKDEILVVISRFIESKN